MSISKSLKWKAQASTVKKIHTKLLKIDRGTPNETDQRFKLFIFFYNILDIIEGMSLGMFILATEYKSPSRQNQVAANITKKFRSDFVD